MTKQDKIALKKWLTASARVARRAGELEEFVKQFGAQYCSIHGEGSVYLEDIKPIAEAMGYPLEEVDCDGFIKIQFIYEGIKFYGYSEEMK